ncbi:MAG: hypothetical protein K6A41_06830 [Bacteroidales bacterium]|nr:hypothetical protein [Bacteroidales bacterium]
MKNRIVIFNQPIEMPGDNMEKIKTFGLLLPKVECETPETISRFIREYIFVIAVIFKHNATFLNGRNFLENGAKFVIYDKKWKQYAKMVKETNVQFAFFDGKVQIQDDDHVKLLLTSKDKWEEMKGMNDISWQ